MANSVNLILFGCLVTCFSGCLEANPAKHEYFGKQIGSLNTLIDPEINGVTGTVYAVNERTVYIHDFTYDGSSDDVFFYATRFEITDERGFRLQDWDNDGLPLRKYNKEGVALSVPGGVTLNDITMVYVWNEKLKVSLGHIRIPQDFDYPKPQKIEPLKGVHAISSGNIIILDMQTLLIPHFYYHGEAVESKFWVSSKNSRYSISGEASKGLTPDGLQIPDENGSDAPLGSYYGKTFILTLPGDLTVQDIGSFGIWDEKYATSYASIEIPDMINLPPSRRMLKISTRSITRSRATEDSSYALNNKIKSIQVQDSENIDEDLLNRGFLPPRADKSDNTNSPSIAKISTGFLPPKIRKNDHTNSGKAPVYKPPTAVVTNPNNDYDEYDYILNDNGERKFNNKRGVKPTGATLTKLNGKWFYLVPANED